MTDYKDQPFDQDTEDMYLGCEGMSYHAEWIVCLIERRNQTKSIEGHYQATKALLRHVRAMFNGD